MGVEKQETWSSAMTMKRKERESDGEETMGEKERSVEQDMEEGRC